MEVPVELPNPLSPRSSPNKSSDIFIAEMSFWLGIVLTSSAHPQEQTKSTQECPTSSQKLSSKLPLLLAFVLISDEGTHRITESTLPNILFNKHLQHFNTEMSFWLGIAPADSVHHNEPIIGTQECPTTISHLLAGWLGAANLPYKANAHCHLFLRITLTATST